MEGSYRKEQNIEQANIIEVKLYIQVNGKVKHNEK